MASILFLRDQPNSVFGGNLAGIGIVTNPHSKLNKRNPERPKILGYILGEQGVLETTNSLEELAQVAKEFKQRKISILAINGGDGTISRTLTAFIREYGAEPMPKIALLRGGTMNVVASSLGIWGSSEQLLFKLVEAHSAQAELETTKLQVLKIANQYGFLFGTGMIAAYLKLYYKTKKNAVGAVLLIMRLVLAYFFNRKYFFKHMKDQKVEIKSDEVNFELNTVAVLCSTVERMPLGYKLFPIARKVLGKMQCVAFRVTAKQLVWKLVPAVIYNYECDMPIKKIWLSNEIKLNADSPINYTIDGELFEEKSGKLKIDCGPALDFVLL